MTKNKKTPSYINMIEDLIQKIQDGTYPVGETLPSERTLCDLYGYSRTTVRRALQELEQDGYIHRVHGKGTFVSDQTYNQKLVSLYSFTEEMKKINKIPTTDVLSFKEVMSDERLMRKMKHEINETDKLYEVKRLRLADNEPLMYETSYIPAELFPDLSKELLQSKPMYEVFTEKYQLPVTRAIESFSATSLREEEAKLLHAKTGSPAMLIKRFAYNDDRLIEYTVSITIGYKFEYTVELK